jgi:type VI secretion system protein ImpK
MSDNPFSEPDDTDRTVIRPAAGRRPASPLSDRMPERSLPPPVHQRDTDAAEPQLIGTNPLVAAAAPLLQLLARLNNTSHPPQAGDLRERTAREIRAFEQRARDGAVPLEQLRPAHYALCASLDDVVLNTPWGSGSGWDARSLVSTFHQEVRGGERFFDLLRQMKQEPNKFLPVIELMYLCLSLGFIGRYRVSSRGMAELDTLREDTYTVLARHRAAAETELSPHWQGVSAPYRPARFRVPLWVAASIGAACIAALFVWFSTGLNGESDAVYERLLGKPWDHMPTIARTAVARPPPPSPAPPDPGALDRLRGFLRPEIQQGLVSVVGTQSIPIVRIANRGLFLSGSATVQPAFKPLLGRIAAALQTEPGRVQLVGYTDNVPIHTVQFPSNFQLSLARAQAARAIITTGIEDPARVTAEGRGDAEPVAVNTTAEGREQNRRIEVVLYRQAGPP